MNRYSTKSNVSRASSRSSKRRCSLMTENMIRLSDVAMNTINDEEEDTTDVKNDDDDILTPDQSISWIGMVCNPSKGLYVSPNVVIEDGANDYRLTFMFKY